MCVRVSFRHQGRRATHRGLVVLSGPMRRSLRRTRARHFRELYQALREVRGKIGQPCYRTAKSVQKGAAPQERQAVEARHGDYYSRFLQERAAWLRGARQTEALETLAVEIENVRLAWRRAVEQGRVEAVHDNADVLPTVGYICPPTPEAPIPGQR
ncbi:MAG TPA: hypothetical protein ENJ31_05635 [Anaerolineae bacterium]|nr:hypothetical protein [Anaerolineae bacterium]